MKRSYTRTTESSKPLKPVVSPSSNPIPHIETWEEQEVRDFLYADQKGWTNLTSTNTLGEKRYYRKEGTQWVRKNTQAETEQPFILAVPQNITPTQQQTQAQQPDYAVLLDNLLQAIIKSELDSYQSFLTEEKVIAEKTKPLWSQIKQIEDKEIQNGCVNPGGAMSFITGQKWTECNNLSFEKIRIADQIAAINQALPYVRPAPPPPRESWIIDRTTRTISTKSGTSKYYYICTSAECRINPY